LNEALLAPPAAKVEPRFAEEDEEEGGRG